MVLPAEVDRVHVHAPVVGPVVGQGDEELGAHLGGSVDDLVKGRDVDVGGAVGIPPLEDHVGRAGTLIAVIRQAVGHASAVLVVEAPSSKDGETGLFGCGQALFDV